MTDRIKAYKKLINMPHSSSLEEEMKVIENIRALLGDCPKLKKTEIVRYVRDTGEKMVCIYESPYVDDMEISFIIGELMKVYPNDKIFASRQNRYEVADGLE